MNTSQNEVKVSLLHVYYTVRNRFKTPINGSNLSSTHVAMKWTSIDVLVIILGDGNITSFDSTSLILSHKEHLIVLHVPSAHILCYIYFV